MLHIAEWSQVYYENVFPLNFSKHIRCTTRFHSRLLVFVLVFCLFIYFVCLFVFLSTDVSQPNIGDFLKKTTNNVGMYPNNRVSQGVVHPEHETQRQCAFIDFHHPLPSPRYEFLCRVRGVGPGWCFKLGEKGVLMADDLWLSMLCRRNDARRFVIRSIQTAHKHACVHSCKYLAVGNPKMQQLPDTIWIDTELFSAHLLVSQTLWLWLVPWQTKWHRHCARCIIWGCVLADNTNIFSSLLRLASYCLAYIIYKF